MSALQFLQNVDQVALQIGFWTSVLFPVLTALYWPWWQSWWGRCLVSLDTAIGLTLLAETMQLEFGIQARHSAGHFLLWVSTVSLCAVPLIIVWRAILVYLVQRRGSGPPTAD